VNIGQRMRQLRMQRGLRANELAAAAEVSPSLISQIEGNRTTPSIDVLRRIAAALRVHVGDFFNPDGTAPFTPTTDAPASATAQSARVVRAHARKKLILPASKSVYELLTPDLQGHLELLWLEIGPGLSAPTEPSIHVGEEVDVVIKGRVHIWVNAHEFVLDEGDSITFESAMPHRTANVDNEPAVLISAIAPPSF
jgi:transcriptional regulator with XRE-family HTH domain